MQCPDCATALPLAAGNCANCGAIIDQQTLQVVVAPPGSQPLTAKQAWQFFMLGLMPWAVITALCWWFLGPDGWLFWFAMGLAGLVLLAKIGRLIVDLWRSRLKN